jgi:hypothetical protein
MVEFGTGETSLEDEGRNNELDVDFPGRAVEPDVRCSNEGRELDSLSRKEGDISSGGFVEVVVEVALEGRRCLERTVMGCDVEGEAFLCIGVVGLGRPEVG